MGMALYGGLGVSSQKRELHRDRQSHCPDSLQQLETTHVREFRVRDQTNARDLRPRMQEHLPGFGSVPGRAHQIGNSCSAVSRLQKKASVEPGFGTPNRLASSARLAGGPWRKHPSAPRRADPALDSSAEPPRSTFVPWPPVLGAARVVRTAHQFFSGPLPGSCSRTVCSLILTFRPWARVPSPVTLSHSPWSGFGESDLKRRCWWRRLATGELKAFSATCTHLDCTVQYRKDMGLIWCACHNGRYDMNGKNVAGPPPRPLEEYRVSLQGDDVFISKMS